MLRSDLVHIPKNKSRDLKIKMLANHIFSVLIQLIIHKIKVMLMTNSFCFSESNIKAHGNCESVLGFHLGFVVVVFCVLFFFNIK